MNQFQTTIVTLITLIKHTWEHRTCKLWLFLNLLWSLWRTTWVTHLKYSSIKTEIRIIENTSLHNNSVVFYITETKEQWQVIRGKFLAINAACMSCACPRSPKGLSPSAHLADGTADLILVRKCSRVDFLRHLLRHINKDDQVHPVRAWLHSRTTM